jgi:hemerythrin
MATKITWTKELYGTGDGTVDGQHQELFNRINAVFLSMEKKDSKDQIVKAFQDLGAFAMEHFSCEEGIMDKKKCSAACVNKSAHGQFLKEFTKVASRVAAECHQATFAAEVENMLIKWLRSHIMTIDSQLRAVSQDKAA